LRLLNEELATKKYVVRTERFVRHASRLACFRATTMNSKTRELEPITELWNMLNIASFAITAAVQMNNHHRQCAATIRRVEIN